jgi:hypothetical protein
VKHVVTKVRKEWSDQGGRHEHIEGVCTTSGAHYTRRQVLDSIHAGDSWVTSAQGRDAVIRPISECHAPGCHAAPYITTRPDNSKDDNLENLPRC